MTHYPHNTSYKQAPASQRGVGLVEVLVALLLLAVAALGYTALQAKALKSTDESLTRTQALTVLRSTAEKIRTNGLGSTYMLTTEAEDGKSVQTKAQILDYYLKILNEDIGGPPSGECTEKGCTPKEMADRDVYEIKKQADDIGVSLGMVVCPGTAEAGKTKCLIAAWNGTTPTAGDESTDCMNEESGAYRFNADCVYMEAY